MYEYADIRQVHLELTTFCNASCPQCNRNISGGAVNPNLPLKELRLEDCRKIFPESFVRQLQLLFVCGNYGDPLMATDTVGIMQYFRESNPALRLAIHTNASGRDQTWWESLAKVLSYCRFSIDGLEDTNHIYRRNTSWKKIMNSIEWYIGAGGYAEWDFIVFKHNQHQVAEAFELSQRLGFKKFNVKKTPRFYTPNKPMKDFQRAVLNKMEQTEYIIEPPDDPRYINESNIKISGLVKNEADFNQYLETTEINCKAVSNKQIYVSAEGLAFPCCYLSNIYQFKPGHNVTQMLQVMEQVPGGYPSLDARKRGIEAIVEDELFTTTVPDSWTKQSFSEGRLSTCARICGNHELCAKSQPYRSINNK